MTDKRNVFTDALETLGTIIDNTQKRDAIHLAVEPVVAKEQLNRGDHVTADGKKCIPYSSEAVGIVDPFLNTPPLVYTASVLTGERFWLVLYPRTIKSLRHVWEHPDFEPSELGTNPKSQVSQEEIEKSKKWIENYVEEINEWDLAEYDTIRDYNDLINAADKWLESEEWLTFGWDNESLKEEFWYHYEIVTGKKVEGDKKRNFFSCQC